MADVEYQVLAELMVKGQQAFKSSFAEAGKQAGQLSSGLKQMGGDLGAFASRAASFAATAAVGVAGVGVAAAGFAAVEIGKNLSMLEDKSIQLSSVIAAATKTPFDEARVSSGKLFEAFRKDAITSAGETADFVGVASSIAGTVMGAGRSMEELRKITQGVIATAPALGTSFTQAGTDVMRMFQGHAGAELPFFRAMQSIPDLGIKTAEAFNQMNVQQRIDITTKALRNPAFLAAAEAMGNTFTGLSSTITDQVKTIGGAVGGPVFEQVKRAMKGVTEGVMPKLDAGSPLMGSLNRIGESMARMARMVSDRWAQVFPNLTGGIDVFAAKLDQGVLRITMKVVEANEWIASHWTEISAGVDHFATRLEHAFQVAKRLMTALGGGDIGKGAERTAEIYAGMKVAAFASPIAAPMAKLAGAAIGVPGLGAAAGAGGAGAGAAGAGASAGAGISAAAAATFAGIAAAAAALAVELGAAIKLNLGGLGDWFLDRWEGLKGSLAPLGTAIYDFAGALKGPLMAVLGLLGTPFMVLLGAFLGMWQKIFEVLTVVLNAITHLGDNLTMIWNSLDDLAMKSQGLAEAMQIAAMAMNTLRTAAEAIGLIKPKLSPTDDTTKRTEEDFSGSMGLAIASAVLSGQTKAAAQAPKAGGAGQKLEVVLKIDLSNDNEEAIFVKGRREIKKAFDMASAEARLMGSTLYGAHR